METKKIAKKTTLNKSGSGVSRTVRSSGAGVKSATPTKAARKSAAGLTIPVYNIKGEEVAKAELPPEIFAKKVNPTVLATYVRVYLANNRAGTAHAKTRAEVTGSTRKIYRQKGTGRARHGARKASLFVGGGVTFGPRAHDFTLKINKKQKKLAMFGALTNALSEGRLGAISDNEKLEPKTKIFAKFLTARNISGKKVLVVVPAMKESSLVLASRNIEKLRVIDIDNLNPYELLSGGNILFTSSALPLLQSRFLSNKSEVLQIKGRREERSLSERK